MATESSWNTAGIGEVEHGLTFAPSAVRPGDPVLLSGDVGRHGIAIMGTRAGLSFATAIESDCAPSWKPVGALVRAGIAIHCLRDLTPGGLRGALIEIAELHRFALTLRNLRFRCRKMYLVRARFSDLIPSTLPTKALYRLRSRARNSASVRDSLKPFRQWSGANPSGSGEAARRGHNKEPMRRRFATRQPAFPAQTCSGLSTSILSEWQSGAFENRP